METESIVEKHFTAKGCKCDVMDNTPQYQASLNAVNEVLETSLSTVQKIKSIVEALQSKIDIVWESRDNQRDIYSNLEDVDSIMSTLREAVGIVYKDIDEQ